MRLFSTCHSSIVRYVLMFSFSAPRRKHNDFRVIFSVYYRCFCRKGSVHNREYLVVVRAHSHYKCFQRGPVFLPWCLSKSLIAWLCGSVMRLNWANLFSKHKPLFNRSKPVKQDMRNCDWGVFAEFIFFQG